MAEPAINLEFPSPPWFTLWLSSSRMCQLHLRFSKALGGQLGEAAEHVHVQDEQLDLRLVAIITTVTCLFTMA